MIQRAPEVKQLKSVVRTLANPPKMNHSSNKSKTEKEMRFPRKLLGHVLHAVRAASVPESWWL
jgi:hypothetical protein